MFSVQYSAVYCTNPWCPSSICTSVSVYSGCDTLSSPDASLVGAPHPPPLIGHSCVQSSVSIHMTLLAHFSLTAPTL